MSSRKGSASKPAPPKEAKKLNASKLSASKSSASKTNMNASLMQPRGSSSTSRNINPEFNSTLRTYMPPPLANASVVPSVDLELECDFAYNDYLQALMMQQLVRKGIASHRMQMNDQLAINSEALLAKRKEAYDLEEEIEKFELKPRLQELMNVVDTTLSKTLEVLNPVEEKLDDLITTLEHAKNQLYLKNVKVFENQESDTFVQLLGACHMAIMKTLNVSPHLEKCAQLTDALRTFKMVEEEIIHWEKSTAQLQTSTINSTLEVVSDVLFMYLCII